MMNTGNMGRKRKRKDNATYREKLRFYYKSKIITKYFLQDEYPAEAAVMPIVLNGSSSFYVDYNISLPSGIVSFDSGEEHKGGRKKGTVDKFLMDIIEKEMEEDE